VWVDAVETYEDGLEIDLLTEEAFIQGLWTLANLPRTGPEYLPPEIQTLQAQMQRWQRVQAGYDSNKPPEYLNYRQFTSRFFNLPPAQRRCL